MLEFADGSSNLQVSRDLFRLNANVSLADNCSRGLNGILPANMDCPSIAASGYHLCGIPMKALWVQMGDTWLTQTCM